MASARGRGLWALPLSMFIGTFAWSFIQVSLPFYIGKISTLDAMATLRWTGWILGVSSLVTMVMAPFSARIFGEKNPKRSYVATQMLQGGGFFLMAVSRTLLQLFFSRMLLGFMGAVSTFAFIMVGPRATAPRPHPSVRSPPYVCSCWRARPRYFSSPPSCRRSFRPSASQPP